MIAPITRHAVPATVCFAILAGLVLAWSFFQYVPLRVDGGWYAYPALAIAQGRDPGENQLPLEELKQGPAGIKAQFEWNSRRSLYVLPAAAWFSSFGHSLLATRMFGISTLLLALALAMWAFVRHGGDRNVAILAWCLLALDVKLIGSGVADMRPDLLLASATLSAFLLMESDVRHRYAWKLPLAIIIATTVPLAHMTSPISLALLFTYGIVRYGQERPSFEPRRSVLWSTMAAVATVTFVLRDTILDMLVPTRVIEPYAFDLGHRIFAALEQGVIAKAAVEAHRWADYFLASNALQLLFILAGAVMIIRALLHNARGWLKTQEAALAVGCAAGLAVMTLFDPIPRGDHGIPLIPFVMLLASMAFSRIAISGRAFSPQTALVVLLATSAALKAAHGLRIATAYAAEGVSNARIASVLAETLKGRQPLVVIGPAEIWPYLDDQANVVIVDERNRPQPRSDAELAEMDLVILNDEFIYYDWRKKFEQQHPNYRLQLEQEIGRERGVYYLGVYRLVRSQT